MRFRGFIFEIWKVLERKCGMCSEKGGGGREVGAK